MHHLNLAFWPLDLGFGDACQASLCVSRIYTRLLNNLTDGTLYIACITVKHEASMQATTFLDLTHRKEFCSMGKRVQARTAATTPTTANKAEAASFGQRLASLRKAAGFTQIELAAELGISQRMVAYYESPPATPPANLLPQIAAALGVSIDELFGVGAKRRLVKQDGDSRLRRRLLAIEKLDVADKRQVLQLLDAFIERGQLKRKAESRA
jgi:transcriptional regulator with XRE-family HTH domain